VQSGDAGSCAVVLGPEAVRALRIAPAAFERIAAQAAELWPTILP
jgi:hypothetical protein